MNALELSNKKIDIIKRINYLSVERNNNNTGTVLLSDEEVDDIIDTMEKCVDIIDQNLSRVKVFDD